MSQRLGDLLVKEKVITQEQLTQATKSSPMKMLPIFSPGSMAYPQLISLILK